MAITLIDVVNEILRACNQITVTGFADTDDSNFLVDRVNDALDMLYQLKSIVIDTNGIITVTPSTRLFSGPTGVDLQSIYDYSYRISQTTGDIKLLPVPTSFIVQTYPLFETQENSMPKYIYLTENKVGVYPLLAAGLSNLTMQFIYPAAFTKIILAADVFPFPDRSKELMFIKKYAQAQYEIWKGLGRAELSVSEFSALKAGIEGKYAREKHLSIKGYIRRRGRAY